MRLALACSLLLSASAFAECTIEPINSPAVIFSTDYWAVDQFGYEYLAYIDGGGIEDAIVSQWPNCPQLYLAADATTPLGVIYAAFQDPFTSDFLFADLGGYIGFYPWPAVGVFAAIGIDLTTGLPIYGQGWVFLTVFKVYL